MATLKLEELPGVGKVTAEKFRSAGIKTVRQLALYTSEELEELAGIDPVRASKILRAARSAAGVTAAITTLKDVERHVSGERLSTGVKSIDSLLGGGLEPGSIYEFAGEYGSGKTQLCHQLVVTLLASGNNYRAFYIDTEGTFSPSRLRAMAKRFNVAPQDLSERVLVSQPLNVEQLEDVVRTGAPAVVEEKHVRLIIVDSIIALYRAQYKGREYLARRQQRINYMLDWLKRLSRTYGVYLVITNQVIDTPLGFGPVIKVPAGGNIIAHASTHRFLLRRAGEKRIITVIDSPSLPYGAAAEFAITEWGVEDVE